MSENEKRSEEPEAVDPTEVADKEEAIEPTISEKVAVHEFYLSEVLKAHQISGQAINRLEAMLFSVIKHLIDKEVMTPKDLFSRMEEITSVENIFDWWGVDEIDRPISPEEFSVGDSVDLPEE